MTILERLPERAWMGWQFSCTAGRIFEAQSFWWAALGPIFEVIRQIEEDGASVRRFELGLL